MKKLLALLILLLAGFGVFSLLRPARDYTNYPPPSGKTWVAFGDSLTAGFGASEGHDYPTLLGHELGWPIVNLGTPGATTHDALDRVEDVLKQQPKVVLLCFGGNDTLNGMPHSQTFDNLARVIDRLQDAGAFVVLIGIRTASVRDKYSSEFKRLARQKRVLYVPNILAGVLGNPNLMSDYVHPNERGYAAIAARLQEILTPFLPELAPG